MRLPRRLVELEWAIYAQRLARSSSPILLGPWRSEVGFELLYWLPFLERFRKTYGIAKDRLIYLGRGGSAQWFDGAGKADLFEFLPVETVRGLTMQSAQQTGSVKQHTEEAWERHVCALAATAMGIAEYSVLSPRWMYRLLTPFWEGRQPLGWLDDYLLHRVTLAAPPLSPELKAVLPDRYLAMRWYARATWPLQESLTLWTRTFTEAVASQMPVVLIDAPFHVDDHADMALGAIPNVFRLSDLIDMAPLDNLAVQSSVIQGARGYIGTYGGMAQGAMRWGIPTLALYAQFGQTSPAHLHLTQSLSLQSGVPFVATHPSQVHDLWACVKIDNRGSGTELKGRYVRQDRQSRLRDRT